MESPAIRDGLALLARILMSAIFLQAGFGKISGYAGTLGYMQSAGVPGTVLPLVILVEIAGGLALLLGLWTRWAALMLAGFTLAAAALFHYRPGDMGQMIHFMKNLAIAGGFLQVMAFGPGRYSLDAMLRGRSTAAA